MTVPFTPATPSNPASSLQPVDTIASTTTPDATFAASTGDATTQNASRLSLQPRDRFFSFTLKERANKINTIIGELRGASPTRLDKFLGVLAVIGSVVSLGAGFAAFKYFCKSNPYSAVVYRAQNQALQRGMASTELNRSDLRDIVRIIDPSVLGTRRDHIIGSMRRDMDLARTLHDHMTRLFFGTVPGTDEPALSKDLLPDEYAQYREMEAEYDSIGRATIGDAGGTESELERLSRLNTRCRALTEKLMALNERCLNIYIDSLPENLQILERLSANMDKANAVLMMLLPSDPEDNSDISQQTNDLVSKLRILQSNLGTTQIWTRQTLDDPTREPPPEMDFHSSETLQSEFQLLTTQIEEHLKRLQEPSSPTPPTDVQPRPVT